MGADRISDPASRAPNGASLHPRGLTDAIAGIPMTLCRRTALICACAMLGGCNTPDYMKAPVAQPASVIGERLRDCQDAWFAKQRTTANDRDEAIEAALAACAVEEDVAATILVQNPNISIDQAKVLLRSTARARLLASSP